MIAARYRVVRLQDGTFGVRIDHPDGRTETVTGFKDEPAAAAWLPLQVYALKREAGERGSRRL